MNNVIGALGNHLFHIEGNLVVLQWKGELHPEDVRQFLLILGKIQAEYDLVFVLVDACSAGKLGSQARKIAATWGTLREFGGVVFFGASFATRVLMNAVSAGYRPMSHRSAVPIQFVKTEPEARAWLDAQRRKHERQGA